jgi:hypothetical protein
VATQGRVPADWHTQWVTKYTLAYKIDDPIPGQTMKKINNVLNICISITNYS